MIYRFDGNFYYEDNKKISKKKYDESISNIHTATEIVLQMRNGEKPDIPEKIADIVNAQLEAWERLDNLKPLNDISGNDAIKIIFEEESITRTESERLHVLIKIANISPSEWKDEEKGGN